MIRTVVAGIVALAIAIAFLGVVLLKIQEPVLWIVAAIGVLMMAWNIYDGVREAGTPTAVGADRLPEDQQERGGVS